MTKYLQTNSSGYVVCITEERALAGLFGGSPKDYKELSDDQAEAIGIFLKAKHQAGEGLHIRELEKVLSGEKK